MELQNKTCVACRGDLPGLSAAEARALLQQVPGWALDASGKWLLRSYTFANFKQALAFVQKVGDVAEQENHHPDITFGWGYVNIRIQTHAIGGLHENDFILAAKINILD